ACGLIQSTLVTEPVSVIGLFRSYCAANEWCARTGAAAVTRRKAARRNDVVVFMFAPFISVGPTVQVNDVQRHTSGCALTGLRSAGGLVTAGRSPHAARRISYRLLIYSPSPVPVRPRAHRQARLSFHSYLRDMRIQTT